GVGVPARGRGSVWGSATAGGGASADRDRGRGGLRGGGARGGWLVWSERGRRPPPARSRRRGSGGSEFWQGAGLCDADPVDRGEPSGRPSGVGMDRSTRLSDAVRDAGGLGRAYPFVSGEPGQILSVARSHVG